MRPCRQLRPSSRRECCVLTSFWSIVEIISGQKRQAWNILAGVRLAHQSVLVFLNGTSVREKKTNVSTENMTSICFKPGLLVWYTGPHWSTCQCNGSKINVSSWQVAGLEFVTIHYCPDMIDIDIKITPVHYHIVPIIAFNQLPAGYRGKGIAGFIACRLNRYQEGSYQWPSINWSFPSYTQHRNNPFFDVTLILTDLK